MKPSRREVLRPNPESIAVTGELCTRLRKCIDSFQAEFDVSWSQLFGALECLKADFLELYMQEADED